MEEQPFDLNALKKMDETQKLDKSDLIYQTKSNFADKDITTTGDTSKNHGDQNSQNKKQVLLNLNLEAVVTMGH